mmetsp:Transcript_23587/g.36292  ORF Transcript_23587/g.36292 Transcript_23587/m.36292 type:complete len:153 (-) Transcript_23587:803-1261(-)
MAVIKIEKALEVFEKMNAKGNEALVTKYVRSPSKTAVRTSLESLDEDAGVVKASVYFYLGQAYEMQRDFKMALHNFKRCIQGDSSNFGATIHLANLLSNLGEGVRAVKYFKHALKLDENSVNANFGIGKTYVQTKELIKYRSEAVRHFHKVL